MTWFFMSLRLVVRPGLGVCDRHARATEMCMRLGCARDLDVRVTEPSGSVSR